LPQHDLREDVRQFVPDLPAAFGEQLDASRCAVIVERYLEGPIPRRPRQLAVLVVAHDLAHVIRWIRKERIKTAAAPPVFDLAVFTTPVARAIVFRDPAAEI
jgi:hypothetical protein